MPFWLHESRLTVSLRKLSTLHRLLITVLGGGMVFLGAYIFYCRPLISARIDLEKRCDTKRKELAQLVGNKGHRNVYQGVLSHFSHQQLLSSLVTVLDACKIKLCSIAAPKRNKKEGMVMTETILIGQSTYENLCLLLDRLCTLKYDFLHLIRIENIEQSDEVKIVFSVCAEGEA